MWQLLLSPWHKKRLQCEQRFSMSATFLVLLIFALANAKSDVLHSPRKAHDALRGPGPQEARDGARRGGGEHPVANLNPDPTPDPHFVQHPTPQPGPRPSDARGQKQTGEIPLTAPSKKVPRQRQDEPNRAEPSRAEPCRHVPYVPRAPRSLRSAREGRTLLSRENPPWDSIEGLRVHALGRRNSPTSAISYAQMCSARFIFHRMSPSPNRMTAPSCSPWRPRGQTGSRWMRARSRCCTR